MAKFEKGNTVGRQFKPGESGNPAGPPKAIREVAAAARPYTEEMLSTLVRIARDTKATAAARVNAAQYILDRAWGKAPATVELRRTAELGNLTDDELIAIAAGEVAEPNGGDFTSGSPESTDKPN